MTQHLTPVGINRIGIEKPKARRGFAAMNPELQREIARKGGASVPAGSRSFSQDRDLAAAAGSKGGGASHGGGRKKGGSNG